MRLDLFPKQAFLDTIFKYSYIIGSNITEATQRRVISSHDLDNGVCFFFPETGAFFLHVRNIAYGLCSGENHDFL